jgi:hypothetical protein
MSSKLERGKRSSYIAEMQKNTKVEAGAHEKLVAICLNESENNTQTVLHWN